MTIFMMLLMIVEIFKAVATMMLGIMFLSSALAAMMILTKMMLALLAGEGEKGIAASQRIEELKQHYGSFSRKRRGAASQQLAWAGQEGRRAASDLLGEMGRHFQSG